MRVDTNTCGHRQWFYFSIKCKSKRVVKLNIYRFKKPYSLYQRGMRPYVKSLKSQQQEWLPSGYNVRYIRQKQANDYGVKKPSPYYYLTFMYQFEYDEDEVFFAAGIPYTYSFLTERLLGFQYQNKKQSAPIKFTQHSLGLTPCGLSLSIVKLQPKNVSQHQPKHIVAINCRTHPGQTSASWVLDGLIDSLLSLTQSQSQIFTKYNICFHILPMLNPDGVFFGNYRTGIVGDDFNRKFSTGRKDLFPEINCLKKMINSSKKQGKIIMFVDLHGHSILKNSFIYGPSQSDFKNLTFRKLPFNLWHKSQYFRLSSCRFQTDSSKIQTARMYFQFKQDILSYTCENSLGLYESSNGQTYQMTRQDWRKFGAGIVDGIRATIQSEKKLVFDDDLKQEKDLLITNTPPIKQSSRLPINKRVQTNTKIKLKIQKNLNISNNQSLNLDNLQNQNTSISNIQKVSTKSIRSRKFQSSFFSSPNKESLSFTSSKEQCKNVIVQKYDGKEAQIRRRFPSLGYRKEGRSKQGTNSQLRSSVKDIRQKVDISANKQHTYKYQTQQKLIQKGRNGNEYALILMTSSQPLPNQNLHSNNNTAKHHLNQNNSNPKREFIQSIYNKRQLKQLRTSNGNNKDNFSLGSKLTPVIENIRLRLQRKNTGQRRSVNAHSVKMISSTTQVISNQTMNNNSGSIFNQPQILTKKDSFDINDGILQSQTAISNNFDNIQISLQSQKSLKQRSRTYDESYLQWQIEKLKQMKQTQRQYDEEDDQELKPWQGDGFNHLQSMGCQFNNNVNEADTKAIVDDKFSQQYNDEVNDTDSQSQDLPQQKKTHVLQYIRSHNHFGQRLRGVYVCGVNNSNQSDQQKKINSRKQVDNERINTSSTKHNNSRKRNINAFREIVFSHGEYLHQPIESVISNIDNSSYYNNINDDRTTRWNNSTYVSSNVNINGSIPKLRRNPHKFKQSLGVIKFKSFASKIQASQKDNVTNQDAIYITHKKKLNERNMRRQSRKDPFVLLSRKEKPSQVGKGYSNH